MFKDPFQLIDCIKDLIKGFQKICENFEQIKKMASRNPLSNSTFLSQPMHLESFCQFVQQITSIIAEDPYLKDRKNKMDYSNNYVVLSKDHHQKNPETKIKNCRSKSKEKMEPDLVLEFNKIEIICQSPSKVFNILSGLKPISMVITSGTISPIEMLEKELEIPLGVQFINNHVIDQKQAFVSVLV